MFARLYEKAAREFEVKYSQTKLHDEEDEMTTQSTCVFALKMAVMDRWEAGDPIEMLYYGDSRPRPKFPDYKARLVVSRTKDGLFWVKKCTFTSPPPKPISVRDYAFLKTYTVPQV